MCARTCRVIFLLYRKQKKKTAKAEFISASTGHSIKPKASLRAATSRTTSSTTPLGRWPHLIVIRSSLFQVEQPARIHFRAGQPVSCRGRVATIESRSRARSKTRAAETTQRPLRRIARHLPDESVRLLWLDRRSPELGERATAHHSRSRA